MKLSSGKRIGQSGGELATAALLSLFLHATLFAGALFYLRGVPLKHVPLFYEVQLVGLPADTSVTPPTAPSASQPALPR